MPQSYSYIHKETLLKVATKQIGLLPPETFHPFLQQDSAFGIQVSRI